MSAPAGAPLFLVRGTPSPEELAAVVAVLTARGGGDPPAPPPPPSPWGRPQLRAALSVGPGAWRASALPG